MAIINPGDVPINEGQVDGTELARRLERLYAVVHSQNSSASRPPAITPGGIWSKTVTGGFDVMVYDGTSDIKIGSVINGQPSFGTIDNATITNGTMDGTAIGSTTPDTGVFTTATADSVITDTVSEKTTNAGVTVDGVLIKDNAVSASNGFTQENTFNSASTMGFKNRIINGAMMIDQRNAGASYAQSTTLLYGLDRWKTDIDVGTGRWSVQQVSDAPTGFTNSLKVTITTQESQPASARHHVYQPIEGYNISDLGFGTVNASQITASFWVKTSVTGIHSLNVASYDYVYTTSYTVNSADTWEYKTITIPGAAAGTWDITNEAGLFLEFTLGGGTDEIVTANTWRADIATGIVVGSVYLPATSGATWQITGVQLEKGSTATSFDYRPYGTELALCQRYFYSRIYNDGSLTYVSTGGFFNTTTQLLTFMSHPVTMRTTPSISYSNITQFDIEPGDEAPSTLVIANDADEHLLGLSIISPTARTVGFTGFLAIDTVNGYLYVSAEL